MSAGSCDSKKVYGALPRRPFLKKFLIPLFAGLLAVCAYTNPLAVIVLNPSGWNVGRMPSDWQVKVHHGKPDISTCDAPDGSCIHLKSVKASFALERGVDVDTTKHPYLTWRWKVSQLPPSGDFRHAATDDQAAQVLV